MNTSPEINEIATALAKAQGEMENVKVNRDNPFFGSKYADRAAILQSVRPLLAKHGIAILQTASEVEGDVRWEDRESVDKQSGEVTVKHIPVGAIAMVTRLQHTSGQFIESISPRVYADLHSQPLGSAITYLQRYGLVGFVGVGIEGEDDDGNAASPAKKQPLRQCKECGERKVIASKFDDGFYCLACKAKFAAHVYKEAGQDTPTGSRRDSATGQGRPGMDAILSAIGKSTTVSALVSIRHVEKQTDAWREVRPRWLSKFLDRTVSAIGKTPLSVLMKSCGIEAMSDASEEQIDKLIRLLETAKPRGDNGHQDQERTDGGEIDGDRETAVAGRSGGDGGDTPF